MSKIDAVAYYRMSSDKSHGKCVTGFAFLERHWFSSMLCNGVQSFAMVSQSAIIA